jgi:hypothetical protein
MPDLQSFAENIWTVEGPIVKDMGLLFTTRMTIVKLSNGSVWVESPVPLPPAALSQIARLGFVRYIVAGTQRHIWRLKEWHGLFPEAQPWASRTAKLSVEGHSLSINNVLTDTPVQDWASDFDQLTFNGNPFLKETFFLHRESGTVILGDLIQANPMMKGRPIRNAVFRLMGAAEPKGGVGLDFRLSFTNRALARQSVERLLSWDFDKLILAHGACIRREAKQYVEEAFGWLTGR